ncbi:MAG: GntR family transcriptional regulator [bacterium]|nr:GntR family transcriptional regulator [bacterium]
MIQLEMEGFVTIAPRRGIFVNTLTIKDIKDFYQVIGALESSALLTAFPNMKPAKLDKMTRLLEGMEHALQSDNFKLFHTKNLEFHNTYILASRNEALIKIVTNLKKRLYEFPSQDNWIKEWELSSMKEHHEFLRLLKEGKDREAADFIRNVHWSFTVQEAFINKYYSEEIEPESPE